MQHWGMQRVVGSSLGGPDFFFRIVQFLPKTATKEEGISGSELVFSAAKEGFSVFQVLSF